MYRKIVEKSRYIIKAGLDKKKTDIFLFAAAIIVLIALVVKFSLRPIKGPRRTELLVSRQCEELFGKETVDMLIREFEEQNPELRIRLEADGSKTRTAPLDCMRRVHTKNPLARGNLWGVKKGMYPEALYTLPKQPYPVRSAAGLVDLVFFEEGAFSGMVRDGALLSLLPYLHTETGASQWAIPLVSYMDLFFYNIDILKKAGFDRPPKTRIEFLACARAAAKLDGVYGAALGLSPDDPMGIRRDIFPWVWAADGDIGPPPAPGRPPEISRAAADIIAFFGQLNREGLLAPGTFTSTGAGRLEEFIDKKIAMMTGSARNLPLLRKRMGDSAFGLTVIPAAVTQGKTRLGLSGIYAGISGDCAHPDEAWAFLAFLAEKGPVLSAKLRAVPGSLPGAFPGISAFPVNYMLEDEQYSKAWDVFEAAEIVEGFSGHPWAEDIDRLVREQLAAAFTQ
jgi:ABC-type glycerol-3-phosphate transport system substrate-binding protein